MRLDDIGSLIWWCLFFGVLVLMFMGAKDMCLAQPPTAPETRLGQDWNEQARQQQDYSQRLNEYQQVERNTNRIDRLEQDKYYNTGWRWRYGY